MGIGARYVPVNRTLRAALADNRDVCFRPGAHDASCCHAPELGKFLRAANNFDSLK